MTDRQPHTPAGRVHAVVWIDHHEARIFHFGDESSNNTQHIIRDEHSPHHPHHGPPNHEYLDKVALDLVDARALLIVGPSSAKHEFYRYLEQRHKALLNRIVGVETLDHPGDGPLLAHAVQSFRAAARLGRPYSPGRS